jgi:hypothetical protein
MRDFEKAEWITETRRQFEALAVEVKMVADDLAALQERVMAACVVVIDPPGPVFVPPVIAIKADKVSVKEG